MKMTKKIIKDEVNQKLPQLVVVGHVCRDINITPSKKTETSGGAGYFVALSAAKVTQPIGLISRIGTDYDPTLLFNSVVSDGVKIIKDKQTMCSTQIYRSESDLTDRDMQHVWGVGPDIVPEDIPSKWLEGIKYVHIATMPPQQQKKFVSFIERVIPNAILSIDTDIFFLKDQDQIDIVKENFSTADIVFANRREYEVLKDLLQNHKFVVEKLDADGAVIRKRGKMTAKVMAPKTEEIDVTGAGDVFAGTFLASLLLGQEEKMALSSAVQAASNKVSRVGI